jgi:hypothetical protein
MFRRFVGATSASGSRAFFFLCLALEAYANMSAENAVLFFQGLFLQSVFITLFSASSYLRFASGVAAGGSIYGHILYCLVGGGLSLLCFSLFLPQPLFYQCLVFGAVCVAISGSIVGMLVRDGNVMLAFLPSTIVAGLFCIFLFFTSFSDVNVFLLCVVGFQIVSFGLLVAVWWGGRDPESQAKGVLNGLLEQLKISLGIGSVNTLTVALFFWVREVWSNNVDPTLAAAAFLWFRLSDMVLQLFGVVLVGSPIIRTIVERFTNIHFIAMILPSVVVVGWLDLGGETQIRALFTTLLLQLCLDVIRVPSYVLSIHLVTLRTTLLYLAFVLIPLFVALFAIVAFQVLEYSNGLYIFMMLNGSVACAFYIGQREFLGTTKP